MERASTVNSAVRICTLMGGVAAAIVLAALPSFANSKADFLIIGEVRSLFIYNQYQQRVSESEKAAFLPFSPFRIIEADDVLGDGFTPCMRVEAENKLFFFEKDTGGQLAGTYGSVFLKTYRNASVLSDTIEIVSNNRVVVSDPPRDRKSPLAARSVIIRLFDHQGFTYVRILGSASRFGWIQFGESRAERDWRVLKKTGTSTLEQLERALPLIRLRVSEVNDKLLRLYAYFNQESAVGRPAPQWRVEQQGNTVLCTMEPQSYADRYTESARLLGKSIEGLLLGTTLAVATAPGRVEIRGEGKK